MYSCYGLRQVRLLLIGVRFGWTQQGLRTGESDFGLVPPSGGPESPAVSGLMTTRLRVSILRSACIALTKTITGKALSLRYTLRCSGNADASRVALRMLFV